MSLPDAPLASPRALPSQFPNSEPVRLPAPGDSSQALDQTRPLDSRLGCGGSGCGTLDVGRGSGSVGSGSGSWSVGAGEGRSPPPPRSVHLARPGASPFGLAGRRTWSRSSGPLGPAKRERSHACACWAQCRGDGDGGFRCGKSERSA